MNTTLLESLGESAAVAAIIAVLNELVAILNTAGFHGLQAFNWGSLINVALVAAIGAFGHSQLKGSDGSTLGVLRGR